MQNPLLQTLFVVAIAGTNYTSNYCDKDKVFELTKITKYKKLRRKKNSLVDILFCTDEMTFSHRI